jgi:hypothetical protein
MEMWDQYKVSGIYTLFVKRVERELAHRAIFVF